MRVIDVRAVCGVISLEPITEHNEATPMQSCDTLDSQLEIFQILNSSFDLKNGTNRALFLTEPPPRDFGYQVYVSLEQSQDTSLPISPLITEPCYSMLGLDAR